jgi:hypothetical protein
MIDWSVLLIPIALLPVVLLFAFVGCRLDKSGANPDAPISFTYPAGLTAPSGPGPALQSIAWQYTLDLTFDPDFGEGIIGSPPTTVGPFKREPGTSAAIASAGETHQHFVQLRTYGDVICTCTVVTAPNPPFDDTTKTITRGPLAKEKIEDEPGPAFQLTRDGDTFQLS